MSQLGHLPCCDRRPMIGRHWLLGRLAAEAIGRIWGAALMTLTETLIAADPDYPKDATKHELDLYKGRMKTRAALALREEEHELRRQSMKILEWEKRKVAAQASSCPTAFLWRARKLSQQSLTQLEASCPYLRALQLELDRDYATELGLRLELDTHCEPNHPQATESADAQDSTSDNTKDLMSLT